MLTRDSINASYLLAQKLADRGQKVVAVNDTPVQKLTNLCLNQALLLTQHSDDIDGSLPSFDTLLVNASTTKLPDGTVPHDDSKAEFVAMAKLAISGGLSLARNVVNPIIEKVVSDVQGYVDSDAELSLRPMNIIPIFYKRIWDSPVLDSIAGRHANQYSDDFDLKTLNIPLPKEIQPALSTGVPSVDSEIAKFVAESSPEFIATIWNEVFNGKASRLSEVMNSASGVPGGTYARADASILVFLAARRLLTDVPGGINIELGALRVYLSELAARAGQYIISYLSRRQRDIARGLIVVSLPSTPYGDIYVLGDTYSQFLQNSGTPEAIFGAVITGKIAEIQVQTDPTVLAGFVENWRRQVALLQQQVIYRRQDVIIRGLHQAIAQAIADAPEDQLVLGKARHQEILVSNIQALKFVEQDSLWVTARALVCRSMFAHTDAEKILSAIDQAHLSNENLNIREVALIATIDYIVEWLCEQVLIERVEV